MLILAITESGKEYMYSVKSARAVSRNSARRIMDICNSCKYLIKEGQKWNCYDIDKYDAAHDVASFQAFKIRKGIVSDCRY